MSIACLLYVIINRGIASQLTFLVNLQGGNIMLELVLFVLHLILAFVFFGGLVLWIIGDIKDTIMFFKELRDDEDDEDDEENN